MTSSEHIITLEREVMNTRIAAVSIILRIIDELGTTALDRQRLAMKMAEIAEDTDYASASIAKCVCLSLRRG
ncbi:hypothetical protein Q9299_19905 [Gemmobacter fulvus]|uniref:hypothetical protein n=1 Tax=Gemmobacter fulvus TaxID=2840474 RepID=UPI0027964FBD|nr:hypothetical protein [Gemmobacter fulvus]MDQ1850574.1 hypothetical protein [Gemmobacter fulvus]